MRHFTGLFIYLLNIVTRCRCFRLRRTNAGWMPGLASCGCGTKINMPRELQHALNRLPCTRSNAGINANFILPVFEGSRQVGEAIHRHPWAMRTTLAGRRVAGRRRLNENLARRGQFHLVENALVCCHDERGRTHRLGGPDYLRRRADNIGQLDHCFTALNGQTGKAGQALTENDWLMSIRSRVGIPGGTCGFDLPAYYAWQHHTPEQRQNDLHQWASTLAPLAESVYLLLRLLRDSGLPQKVAADRGQFQQNLPPGRTFQLLRLRMDPALGLVPEISGNRLIVSVRLMRQEEGGKLLASNEDAAFELTLCS